jgi:hypothetical protein
VVTRNTSKAWEDAKGKFWEELDEELDDMRLHLDLASGSFEDQEATVARLVDLGAERIDIGQGEVPWVVLADPEGNEFCVLEPRDTYREAGAIAAVVVASRHPRRSADFWVAASGWDIAYEEEDVVGLRSPNGTGPMLEFLRSDDPKRGKNRVHLDVAPRPDDHQSLEVDRLIRLGAEPVDIGQSEVPWDVLTDPEGNEFCVLPPR